MSTQNPKQQSPVDIVSNKNFDAPRYARQQIKGGQARKQAHANSSLPEDAYSDVSSTIYDTFDRELRIVNDLRGAGLTTNIPYYAETTEWDVMDAQGEAVVAMDPETATPESTGSYGTRGVPVPVVMDDFSTGYREGGAMDAAGIDTLPASITGRNVAEKSEDLVINGWDATINTPADNYSLYGLTNHPQMDTGTLSADWSTDNTVIREDLRAMARTLKNDNQIRPGGAGYWTYLSTDLYDNLDDVDPQGDGNLTVRDRVENLSDIGAIRQSDFLPDGTAVMFRPTEDVIDLAIAVDEDGNEIFGRTVQWGGPFRDSYKTMNIFAPRVKATKADQVGVTTYTV